MQNSLEHSRTQAGLTVRREFFSAGSLRFSDAGQVGNRTVLQIVALLALLGNARQEISGTDLLGSGGLGLTLRADLVVRIPRILVEHDAADP